MGIVHAATVSSSAARTEALEHLVRIEGRGPLTVILEGGLGDTLDIWDGVQSSIASHCARTLAYNRAGYPGSTPTNTPRDAATIVAELRAELSRQSIAPPYVLVGHSLGGLYMQYFARQYPDEVNGILLIDSTHWNQHLQIDSQANSPYTQRRAVTLFMPLISRRELADSVSAGDQVHASPRAGPVRAIVLSSTTAALGEAPASRTQAARFQEDIVADFPAAKQIRVDSGHYIQRDRPDIVVNAARELAGCKPLRASIGSRK
ncbi:MAG TPA: alpha/beta hydrolase family protein [Steroidobacteraceae bacterium]|jgi:pimeloyl-ACP methyl ester carboxylesterase